MRELNENMVEIFRRSEQRIKERRRRRGRVLALCIPVCLIAAAAWLAVSLPAMMRSGATVDRASAEGDVLGNAPGSFDGSIESAPGAPSIEFGAQYIRTDGYHEGVKYPVVRIIRSVQELDAYYEAYKEEHDLGRKDKVYSDMTIGFLDACDRYDEAYFEEHILVMVLLEEGSGSIRHEVQSVHMSADGRCYIYIDRIVPEAGTCDMAEWHILIEPEAGVIIGEPDITVFVDGINPLQPDPLQ